MLLRRIWKALTTRESFEDAHRRRAWNGDLRTDTEHDPMPIAERVAEAVDDMRRRTMTLIPGQEPSRILLDALFIVWRRNMMGLGYPSLDLFDPRSSFDWKLHKQRMIAIYPLTDEDRTLTFEEIVAKYPCPERSDYE